MNLTVLAGNIVDKSKMAIIEIENTNIFMCKFVLRIPKKSTILGLEHSDFYECFALEDTAKTISDNFNKADNMFVVGQIKNHNFQDINKTVHHTNIILVYLAEKNKDWIKAKYRKVKDLEADIQEMDNVKKLEEIFDKICMNGFLCIDEDDYYDIASGRMAKKIEGR